MKNRLYPILILLLLALPALACGVFSPDPTPTPEPTATTAPTSTPAPTATPVPSPTPEPSPTTDFTANFVTYENAEMGLSVQHPADWAIQDIFALLMATDEELFDSPDSLQEGAVVAVIAGDTASMGGTDPVALVSTAVEQFGLSEDAAIVEGPDPTTIQGQEAAIARIEGTSDETGEARVGLVVVIINGDWAAVGLGYTSADDESQYLPIIEAVLNTIVVSEPAEAESETPNPAEAIPLAVGDSYPGTLAEDGVADFVFTGQAASVVTVRLEPLADDLDVVFEIFDAEFDSLLRLDSGFSGEAEESVFSPPADGIYYIRVQEFYGTAGDFELSLTAGGIVETPTETTQLVPGQLTSGTLAGAAVGYTFQAAAGQPTTIVMIPEEGLDATLAIADSAGNVVVPEVDEGFSGEIETITFTPAAAGEYIALADAFSTPQGGYRIIQISHETAFTAEATLADDGSQNYRVCVPANASPIVIVQPDEDFDVVLNLSGPGGGTLIDEVDSGFSGEPEVIFLTESIDPNANYPVIITVDGFAGQGGSFSIIITSTAPEPVVPDGC